MPHTLARSADPDLTVETEVKRSRFIAAVRRVEDADAAQAFVQSQRRAYPDARHHCWAYVLGNEIGSRIGRSSDDGEPGGTAGIPMLRVLEARDLVDIVVVVTRYFGGTKLGAGGLVRAYSGAVTAAMDVAPLVPRERRHLWSLAVEHADAGRVESELRARRVAVVDTTYAEFAVITLAVRDSEELADLVAAVTSGTGTLDPVGEMWVDA